jgi:GAF domain-containing protein
MSATFEPPLDTFGSLSRNSSDDLPILQLFGHADVTVGTALKRRVALTALSLLKILLRIADKRNRLKLKNFDQSTKNQNPNPSCGGDQESNDQRSNFFDSGERPPTTPT